MTAKVYPTQALVEKAKVTYRQIDFWTTKGWLKPVEGKPGKGVHRFYNARALTMAILMGSAVRMGLSPVVAHQAATALARGQEVTFRDGKVEMILRRVDLPR